MLNIARAVKRHSFELLLKLEQIFVVFGTSDSLYVFPRVAQIGTRFILMVPVVSETEPAKFVAALSAGHVHTTLVFLNIALALGTRLGV